MTCIVGCVDKGTVYIGGDSAGVAGYHIRIRNDEKVFVREEMVFGFTSSFRMGQLLRYSLTIPEHSPKKTDMQYLCTDFMTAVIKCFKDNSYAKVENGIAEGGVFLMGYRGSLYRVDNDFQVGQEADNFSAVGCGESYAFGALKAVASNKISSTKRLEIALEIAAYFSAGVCAPFRVVHTP